MDAGTRQLVDDDVERAPAEGGSALPSPDLSSAIYGSLLVTSLVAVQARSDASPEFVAITVIIAVVVFWLTDVWTGLVALRLRGPITWAGVRGVARAESPMLSAAILPVAIMATAVSQVIPVGPALDLALLACIVQLFVWGLAVGRALHRGWPVTLLVAGVDCLLGCVIVVLKVIVLH